MSSNDERLPPDLVDAVDRWLDSSAEADLDALQAAVDAHPELDGPVSSRARDLHASLARPPHPRRGAWWGLAMVAAALLMVGVLLQAGPTTLVTPEEASAPRMDGATRGGAGTSGAPTLTILAPRDRSVGPGPFDLVLEASPGPAGTGLDHASLRVMYLRGGGVDLTKRLDGRWEGDRYVAPGLRLPPGLHPLRVEVRDVDLVPGSAEVVLEVRRD